jgi:uncharacterized protein (TIGR03435 family)
MRATIAFSSLVFSSLVLGGTLFGQSFDVASIKPSLRQVGRDANNQLSISPSALAGRNVTLKRLIGQAYGMQPFQIFGGPNWLDTAEYDLDAKADGPVTRERLAQMLQPLLAARFHLAVHRDARELRVYELVVDKGGPKIHPLKDEEAPAAKSGAAGGLRSFRGDLQQFANLLSVQLSIPIMDDPGKPGIASGPPVPVVDKTGLQGIFDLNAEIRPETGVDLFTLWQRVLREQLGLRLESRKDKVDVLVVDGADRTPTAN